MSTKRNKVSVRGDGNLYFGRGVTATMGITDTDRFKVLGGVDGIYLTRTDGVGSVGVYRWDNYYMLPTAMVLSNITHTSFSVERCHHKDASYGGETYKLVKS